MNSQLGRRILFWMVMLSLIVVPYSLMAYFCYEGLCGGAAATTIAKHYKNFYGYFWWIYLLVVIVSLIFSRIFKNRYANISFVFLLVPLLCLIPFVYVEYQADKIESQYHAHACLKEMRPHFPRVQKNML